MTSRLCTFVLVCFVVTPARGQVLDLPLDQSGFELPFAPSRTQQAGLLVSVFDKPSPETRRDLLTIQQAAIEIAKKASACTVALHLGREMGSGVVISEDGYILTAAHVVSEPGRRVTVLFPDGREVSGESLGMHTTADGALVKIMEEDSWPFVPLATPEQSPEAGDWCLALGHPGGFDKKRSPPVRLGRVIDVRSTVMQTDCPIMGGDSGGPLFDLRGHVIGIHSRIAEDLTENYHVPSNAYHDAWDRMKAGKIYPAPIPSKLLSHLDRDDDGLLTKEELKSKYHKRVFDRLVEEFGLDDGEDLSIKSITKNEFKWRHGVRGDIVEIEETRDFSRYVLSSEDFVRGTLMEDLVANSLQQVEIGGANVSDSTVRIYADGRRVSLGTVVDRDGFVLTKASRLDHDELDCRMHDGTRRSAELVARDEEYDLALLKVAASNLAVPIWNTSSAKQGQIVAIPKIGGELESIGVVSVTARRIDEIPARMGVAINIYDESKVLVDKVGERSGAARAGIMAGDVLTNVAGERVNNIKQIHRILEDYRAGDEISVVVRRNSVEMTLVVRLISEADIHFGMDMWRMGGRLSRLRDGFGAAFQIDAVVEPHLCGGPVVDMNGQVMGVTLARASRVASYAISARELQPVLERLLSQANSVSTTKLEKPSDQTVE